MSHTVRIEDVKSQPLAIVRRRASSRELSKVVPEACGDAWNRAKAHGIEPRPGRLVAVYLDDAINLEVGVEVTGAFKGAPDLARSATPAGRVATVAHIGPYTGLHGAHQAIRDWCKEHGEDCSRLSWEVYGHWTDDPAQLRTDVFYLLEAK